MTESMTIDDDSSFPCPRCGYDLRAHPDHARCPECGRAVTQSAVLGAISHWVDRKLLDLWSIAVLQSTGLFCMVVAILAVRAGQYVAVGLGLAASFHLVVATCWYLVLWCRFCGVFERVPFIGFHVIVEETFGVGICSTRSWSPPCRSFCSYLG